MLANLDGNLVCSTYTPAKQQSTVEMSPTKEFLNLSSAARSDRSCAVGQALVTPQSAAITPFSNPIEEEDEMLLEQEQIDEISILPQTPTPALFEASAAAAGSFSPTTPYYMSQGAKLIQQTCPPKQTGQALFPVSGEIEEQPDESVRQRLMLARRKSLQFAPKVGSPLGKPLGFGN